MKSTVLDYNDIIKMVPALEGKHALIKAAMKFLSIDKVNAIHARHCAHPGPQFCADVINELGINLRIDNEQILDSFGTQPFITVSNHAFGALDGIVLIDIVGKRYPQFKVMVNMMLNYISAMRPNFIAVDALASDDPAKRAVSMNGIKEAINQVRSGQPLGFFPAGAVSKLNRHGWLEDRDWQPSIGRIIKQLKVPVVPIYFHGGNSWWFNFLGLVNWQLRTLRLPAEVFNKNGKTIHVSIGEPITVEQQLAHAATPDQLCEYLKQQTYSMRKWK